MAPLTLTLTLTADGDRFIAEVKRVEGALDRLAAGEQRATSEAEKASSATSRLGEAANRAAGRLAHLRTALVRAFEGRRHLIQQVAFQLQDVVTQLQLGAPAAQVLAVQGGQLAAAFGPLATIFAALAGAAIGLGGALLTLSDDAEEAASQIDELGRKARDAARRFLESAKTAEELRRRFARLSAEERDLLPRLVEADIRALERQIEDAERRATRLAERIREAFGEARARAMAEIRNLEIAPFDVFDETVSGADVEAARAFAARIETLARAFEQGELDLQALAIRLDALAKEAPTAELRELADRVIEVAGAAASARREADDLRTRLAALRGEVARFRGRLFDVPEDEDGGRDGGRDAARRRRILAELTFEVEARRRLLQALKEGAEAYQQETVRIEAERIARRAGIDTASEEFQRILELVRVRRELVGALEAERRKREGLSLIFDRLDADQREAVRRTRDLEAASRSLSRTVVSGFLDAARGVESFGDVAGRVLDQLTDKLLQLAVMQPLENALTGFLEPFLRPFLGLTGLGDLAGSVSGSVGAGAGATAAGTITVPSSNGNIFDRGHVLPFARGGVIDRPVVFPLGLAGERGPEAILPLRRLPDGRLGVSAAGGTGAVAVNIRVVDARGGDADTIAASVRGYGPDSLDIDLVVLDALRRLADSGRLDDVLGPTMGVRRRLV